MTAGNVIDILLCVRSLKFETAFAFHGHVVIGPPPPGRVDVWEYRAFTTAARFFAI